MARLIWWSLLLATISLYVAASSPTKTLTKRQINPRFVSTTNDGRFMFNGSEIKFVGTTAYWLPALNSLEDIDFTLGNISQAGFNAVRVWGFNDVEEVPVNGTWFQLIQNGTTVINNGTNGLQKLDAVVNLAQKHGVFVIMSLTNNWNPRPLIDNISDPLSAFRFGVRDVTNGTNNSLPRNTLSNDYGGMDVYVRQFGGPQEHDQFYRNETLISAFRNYTAQVVSRYVDNPIVLSWEIANDPRCGSSISAAPDCNPQHVTRWHDTIGQHIKTVDPNHLVSSGHQGFLCMGCPKLFPLVTPPPPQTSPVPGARRRNIRAKALTAERILKERKEAFKKTRALAQKLNPDLAKDGIRIRGRWIATGTRRQEMPLDPAQDPSLNGMQGVDSEDILGSNNVDLGSAAFFPDQNFYGPSDPSLPPFNSTLQLGLNWIRTQSEIGSMYGKPVIMAGMGIVTQGNAQAYVPFNSTVAPFGADNSTPVSQPFGVTDAQRDDFYAQLIQAALTGGLAGIIQYQWSQSNLQPAPGTPFSTPEPVGPLPPGLTQSAVSPNDGYGVAGIGFDSLVQTVNSTIQQFGGDQVFLMREPLS